MRRWVVCFAKLLRGAQPQCRMHSRSRQMFSFGTPLPSSIRPSSPERSRMNTRRKTAIRPKARATSRHRRACSRSRSRMRKLNQRPFPNRMISRVNRRRSNRAFRPQTEVMTIVSSLVLRLILLPRRSTSGLPSRCPKSRKGLEGPWT